MGCSDSKEAAGARAPSAPPPSRRCQATREASPTPASPQQQQQQHQRTRGASIGDAGRKGRRRGSTARRRSVEEARPRGASTPEEIPVLFERASSPTNASPTAGDTSSRKFSKAFPASVAVLSVGTSAGGLAGWNSSRGSRTSRFSIASDASYVSRASRGARSDVDGDDVARSPAPVVLFTIQASPLVMIKRSTRNDPPPPPPAQTDTAGVVPALPAVEAASPAAEAPADDAPAPTPAAGDDAAASPSPKSRQRRKSRRAKELPEGKMHDIGSYTVFKFLGSGSWASVHQCRHQDTGQNYAIKSWDKRKMEKEDLEKSGKREAAILKRLAQSERHANIANYVESLESTKWYHLVVDLGEGGDFRALIKAQGVLTEAKAKGYFRQLLSAMKFIHSKNICHRDIKPENLLLGEGDTLLITDFGLGDFIKGKDDEEKKRLTERCGTPDYVAPEVLRGNGYDGPMADAWSCGITLYVFLVGRTPWVNAQTKERFKEIAKGTWRHENNRDALAVLTNAANSVLGKLLRSDPTSRYSVGAALRHGWFKTDDTLEL